MIYHEFIGDYTREREVPWAKNCQGITHDDKNWYISQQYRIWKFPVAEHDLNDDVNLLPVTAVTGPDFFLNDQLATEDRAKGIKCFAIPRNLYNDGYNHFGDIDYSEGYILAPLEFDDYKKPPKILVINASNLSNWASGDLEKNKHGQHAGWCAINPCDKMLYTSDYSEVSCLHVYELDLKIRGHRNQLTRQKKVSLLDESGQSLTIKNVQGGVFSAKTGFLYLSSHAGFVDGGIYIFDARVPQSSFRLLRHVQVDYMSSVAYGEELEGLTIWDTNPSISTDPPEPGLINIPGQLHLVMLDNDFIGRDDTYIKHFRILVEAESPLRLKSRQQLEAYLPHDKKMITSTGLIDADFRGYARRIYKSINPPVVEYLREKWFSFEISFLIGPRLNKTDFISATVTLQLAGISNSGESLSSGWSVENSKAVWDADSERVKISATVSLRDTDGYLHNLSYKVTILVKTPPVLSQ